jgi:TatA/E family protein of Tat protein translocase
MFGIGPLELGIVLVIALLILGPKKLPELARGLGKGLSEFRRASNDLRRSLDVDLEPHKIDPPPAPAQTSAPHLPPDVGSALDQAEKDAEQAAGADAPPAALRPEPAPAAPGPQPLTPSASQDGDTARSAEETQPSARETEASEGEDESASSDLPRGGTGSPGG